MNNHLSVNDFHCRSLEEDRAATKELARVYEIGPLNSDHWKVIDFVRGYFKEYGMGPSAYSVHRGTGFRLQRLYELFPGHYLDAHLLAGLPNPGKEEKMNQRENGNLGADQTSLQAGFNFNEKSASENSLDEDLQMLPFAGLPFSYEGRFSALLGGDWDKNLNENRKSAGRGGGIERIPDDSFGWLFPFPLIARYKFVPFFTVIAVALLVSFALIKNAFEGRTIGMTTYQGVIRNGSVEIPLKLVQEKRLVSFEYRKPGGTVPLLAYVTPSGKIGTAVGFSFPCHSDKFHLEGKEIVCEVCLTRWDLETLRGIAGECVDHPLDQMPNEVEAGKVKIQEAEIQNWRSTSA